MKRADKLLERVQKFLNDALDTIPSKRQTYELLQDITEYLESKSDETL